MSAALAEFVTEAPTTDAGCAALPLRIEVRSSSDRTAVLNQWRTLETELAHARLTSSSVWVDAWLTHYGLQVPHEFLVGRRGERVVGICLVTESIERRAGVTIRTRSLGTAGESDADSVCVEYNSLLVHPSDRAEFAVGIQRQLEQSSQADAVAWDGFDPEELPRGMTEGSNWRTVIKPTFYYDLDSVRADGADPITRFGDSTRKGIRQNLRDLGKVDVDWSDTPSQADEYYAELIALHQARWQATGESGSFASHAFREFHRDVLQRLVPLGHAALVRVRAGDRTIGCTLLHLDRNRALVYQGGWAQNGPGKSPGLINDYSCLVECFRRGYAAYDFMAGDSLHKRRMTTDQGRLVWATCRLSAWKFNVIERLRSAKQWLHSWSSSPKETA